MLPHTNMPPARLAAGNIGDHDQASVPPQFPVAKMSSLHGLTITRIVVFFYIPGTPNGWRWKQ